MRLFILVTALLAAHIRGITQGDSIDTRVILVGDAGALIEGKASVLQAIRKNVKLDKKTVVVYLGDNLYDAGLPHETYNRYSEIKAALDSRSEEHTSELQSQSNLVCRLLLEKKKK